MPCPLCFNACLCCACLVLCCAMVLCAPMPWAVVLALVRLRCGVVLCLYVCNIISLYYALLYGGIGYKNRACYRLNIWGGGCYFLFPYAIILSCLKVQWSPDFYFFNILSVSHPWLSLYNKVSCGIPVISDHSATVFLCPLYVIYLQFLLLFPCIFLSVHLQLSGE